jgi:hypothetical protein
MFTIELEEPQATVPEVKKRLHLADDQIDADFGVVSIDPQAHLYAILVEEGTTPPGDAGAVSGPYSNPRIETFGPPRSEAADREAHATR